MGNPVQMHLNAMFNGKIIIYINGSLNGKIIYKWTFSRNKSPKNRYVDIYKWWIFQIAMLDDTGGPCLSVRPCAAQRKACGRNLLETRWAQWLGARNLVRG